MDEHGNVLWRHVWKNELAKLQSLTDEQDKLMAEPEWYREMLFRVRTAMIAPIDQNGILQTAPVMPHDGSLQAMGNHTQVRGEDEHE